MAYCRIILALLVPVIGLVTLRTRQLGAFHMRGPQSLQLLGDAVTRLRRGEAGRARLELRQRTGDGGGVRQQRDRRQQWRGARRQRQCVDDRSDDRGRRIGYRGHHGRQRNLGRDDLHLAVRGGSGRKQVARGVAGRRHGAAAGAAGGIDDVENAAHRDRPGNGHIDLQRVADGGRADRHDLAVKRRAEDRGVDGAGHRNLEGTGHIERVGIERVGSGIRLAGNQRIATNHVDLPEPAGSAHGAIQDAVGMQGQRAGTGARRIGDGGLDGLARADIDEAVAGKIHRRSGVAGEAAVEIDRAGAGHGKRRRVDRAVEGDRVGVGAGGNIEEGVAGRTDESGHRRAVAEQDARRIGRVGGDRATGVIACIDVLRAHGEQARALRIDAAGHADRIDHAGQHDDFAGHRHGQPGDHGRAEEGNDECFFHGDVLQGLRTKLAAVLGPLGQQVRNARQSPFGVSPRR